MIASFAYALAGLRAAIKRDRNMRNHLAMTVLVVSWGASMRLPAHHWLWIALAITLVFVTELFNTSLEVVVDLVSPGYHELAGLAKDIAAGAVLVASGFAVLVGVIILGPSLWQT